MIDPYGEEHVAKLMQLGYSNDAIKAITDGVNEQVTELAKQGKSNQEIESYLSKVPVTKDQTTIYPWQPPKVDFNVTPGAKVAATRAVNPTSAPIADVQPPTTMQNIASGPIGGAIEFVGKGLSRAAPFPGLIKGITGENPNPTLSDIANPLPEIATDPLMKVLEGIKKIGGFNIPGTNIEISGHNTAKMIEDAMASLPAFQAAKLLREGAVTTTTRGREVSPQEPIKSPIQGLGQPQLPITEGKPVTATSISTAPQSSVIGQTSTPSKSVSNLPALTTDPIFLDNVKQARQHAILRGDVELYNKMTDILEKNNVTDFKPSGEPGPMLAFPKSEEVIATAKSARDFGEQINNQPLVNRANEVINNNGIVKVIELPDLNSEVAADLNISASTITNKNPFDPNVYKKHLQAITAEPQVVGKTVKETKPFSDGKTTYTHQQALDNIDVPKDSPTAAIAGSQLIESAKRNGFDGTSSLADDPSKYLSENIKERNRQADGTIPPDMQGGGITGNSPGKRNPIDTPIASRIIPFYRIAAHIESRTGIPVLTKLYDLGRIAGNQELEFKLAQQQKIADIFGEYTRPKQRYIKANEKMSDAIKNVLEYDSKIGEITWKDSSGVGHTGNIAQAARDLGLTPREMEIVGKSRDFLNTAFPDTGLSAEQFMTFYLPKRWKLNPEERFKFMSEMREDQQPFFSYQRQGLMQPRELETNLFNLMNIYVNEWAKTKYLMPWKKEIADPILNQVVKYPGGASSVPLSYIGHYVEDVMGIPRTGAVHFNDTVGKFIDNWVAWKNPKLAEDMYAWLGRDRPGEVLGSKMARQQYAGALGYRPTPMIKNGTQRFFATPLLPNGLTDLARGEKLMFDKANHEILQLSGVFGYLGDLVDKNAVSESKFYSPLHYYQAMENSNRGSIYLAQYHGLTKDLADGMTPGQIAKKYNFDLFPEPLQKKWMEQLKNKEYGDIRTKGLENNAIHSIADWTQLITQFPYDKGGGIGLFNSGPVAKQFGVFNTWMFFTGDYMARLANKSIRSPSTAWNFAKMMGIFGILDTASYNLFGVSMLANPLSNIQTKIASGPLPQLAEGAGNIISGTIKDLMSNAIEGRDNEYGLMQRSEGWKQLRNSAVTLVPGGRAMLEAYRVINPKQPKETSIGPD